jgi:hypothetical protein
MSLALVITVASENKPAQMKSRERIMDSGKRGGREKSSLDSPQTTEGG